jgi:hypothetical protein
MTPEARAKMGLAQKGKKASAATRARMSEAGIRRGTPWLIGRTLSDEVKAKIAATHRANPNKPWLGKHNVHCSGQRSHFWKGGVSQSNRLARAEFMRTIEYKAWRRAVFARDNYSCVLCGIGREGIIQADHVKPYSLYPEVRTDINNGRTLCTACHRKTDTYGRNVKVHKYEERNANK